MTYFVLLILFSGTVCRREPAREPAVPATDRQTITPDELREAQALVEEIVTEQGYLSVRLDALEERKRGEGKKSSALGEHGWCSCC